MLECISPIILYGDRFEPRRRFSASNDAYISQAESYVGFKDKVHCRSYYQSGPRGLTIELTISIGHLKEDEEHFHWTIFLFNHI